MCGTLTLMAILPIHGTGDPSEMALLIELQGDHPSQHSPLKASKRARKQASMKVHKHTSTQPRARARRPRACRRAHIHCAQASKEATSRGIKAARQPELPSVLQQDKASNGLTAKHQTPPELEDKQCKYDEWLFKFLIDFVGRVCVCVCVCARERAVFRGKLYLWGLGADTLIQPPLCEDSQGRLGCSIWYPPGGRGSKLYWRTVRTINFKGYSFSAACSNGAWD